MMFLSTLLTSVLLTILLVPLFSKLALHYQFVDLPNERKVHTEPIPRVGGMAMALGAFVPSIFWLYGNGFIRVYLLAAAVLVAFGVADDLRELSPKWKFLGQLAAAGIVVVLGGVQIVSLGGLLPEGMLLPVWLAIPLTVFVIVGVTNAINLSDGLDGLAGGISLLGLCCIGYLAFLEGDVEIGLATLALCGGIFGFLRYNTFPASVFMGDTGSQLLGFSAVTLALALTQGPTALSPVLPLIILGFPILDTLTVMTVRIAQGRSPFSADKNHFHHNLLKLGLHQTESVLVIYVIQALLVLAAFALRFHSDWLLLGGYLGFAALMLTLFSVSVRTGWHPKRHRQLIRAKCYLRWLRDDLRVLRYLFRALEYGFPLLLVGSALLLGPQPRGVSLVSGLLVVLIAAAWWWRVEALRSVLRKVLYLIIPFVIYLGDASLALPLGEIGARLDMLVFAVFAILNVAVAQLSKRTEGFHSTPLDFLILFVALATPFLPVENSQTYHQGVVAAKIIIFYYSCEVLLVELRGDYRRLAAGTVVALIILGSKGFGVW